MSPDDLSPAERVEVQAWYIRAWHARRRRARYDELRGAPAHKRYDVAGRLVAVAGEPCEPHVPTWGEDRPDAPRLTRVLPPTVERQGRRGAP